MTTFQYQSKIFAGKRLRGSHLKQYPCFDVRAELATEFDLNSKRNNTNFDK